MFWHGSCEGLNNASWAKIILFMPIILFQKFQINCIYFNPTPTSISKSHSSLQTDLLRMHPAPRSIWTRCRVLIFIMTIRDTESRQNFFFFFQVSCNELSSFSVSHSEVHNNYSYQDESSYDTLFTSKTCPVFKCYYWLFVHSLTQRNL